MWLEWPRQHIDWLPVCFDVRHQSNILRNLLLWLNVHNSNTQLFPVNLTLQITIFLFYWGWVILLEFILWSDGRISRLHLYHFHLVHFWEHRLSTEAVTAPWVDPRYCPSTLAAPTVITEGISSHLDNSLPTNGAAVVNYFTTYTFKCSRYYLLLVSMKVI